MMHPLHYPSTDKEKTQIKSLLHYQTRANTATAGHNDKLNKGA